MEIWGLSGSHDRQRFCPAPEQPATLPLDPGCTRACQELDRAGRDLAVTGYPCPFLLSLWERDEVMAHGMWGLPGGTGRRNDGTSRGEGNWPPTATNQFGSMVGSLTDEKYGHKAKS